VEEAAEEILRAVREGVPILLFGDYDVDGITSTALMKKFLERAGAKKVRAVVPERSWGYGLTPRLARKITLTAPRGLVVALDNGTKEVESVELLRRAGWSCVIFDHHERGEKLPAAPLVNPKVSEENPLGLKDLSTAGLVYLFGKYLESLGFEVDADSHLDLAAVGTVADVSPMGATNSLIVSAGLKLLRSGEGATEILKLLTAKLRLEHLNEQDISFKIAPRFNAFGRMGKANLGLKSLLADGSEAERYLELMEKLNRERRKQTERAVTEALNYYAQNPMPALVYYSPDLPKGILGIVAGRTTSLLGVPSVIFTRASEDELVGSARSPEGLNIVELLREVEDLLIRWGGHPQAAGLSIKVHHYAEFKARFVAAVEKKKFQSPPVEVDFPLQPTLLRNSPALREQINKLAPFGTKNPFPTFVFDDFLKDFRRTPYGYLLLFEKNGKMFLNTEGDSEKIPPVVRNRKVRVVYQLTNPLRGEMTAIDFMVIS
jgi:single-stranded-DNA-specific exonuclease